MFTCEFPAAARLTGMGMVMICWPFSDWGNDKAVGVGWKLNMERLASWRVVGAYTIPWGVWYITTPGVIAAEFCEPTIDHKIFNYSCFYKYKKTSSGYWKEVRNSHWDVLNIMLSIHHTHSWK